MSNRQLQKKENRSNTGDFLFFICIYAKIVVLLHAFCNHYGK